MNEHAEDQAWEEYIREYEAWRAAHGAWRRQVDADYGNESRAYWRRSEDIAHLVHCARKWVSDFGTVSSLWPAQRRWKAVEEVYRRLPPGHFERLVAKGEIQWIMPDRYDTREADAYVFRTAGPVIFVTERTDEWALPARVGLVAHELAHVTLRHPWRREPKDLPFDVSEARWRKREEAADALVRDWGFENDLEALEREHVNEQALKWGDFPQYPKPAR